MMETERMPCTRAAKGRAHSLQDPTPTLWSLRQCPPCAVRVLCPLYASQLPAAPRVLQSKAPQAWRSPHNHRYCSQLTCLRDSLLVSAGLARAPGPLPGPGSPETAQPGGLSSHPLHTPQHVP